MPWGFSWLQRGALGANFSAFLNYIIAFLSAADKKSLLLEQVDGKC